MENEREPLGTKSVNVATVRPTVSKLPALTPRSRLPTPGMKQKQTFSVCGEKRKASGSPNAADKKICFNLSMSSDVSSASDVSTVSSLSSRSSGSRKATVPVSRGGRQTVSRVAGTNGPRTNGPRGAAVGVAGKRPVPVASTARKAPGGAAGRPPPRPATSMTRPPTTTTTKTNTSGVGGGKKRAAWDLKGRLQDMESAMTQLLKQKQSLEIETCTSGDRLAQMEELNNKLQGAVVEKDSEAQSIQQRAARLQQQLREVEDEHDHKVKKLQRDISDAEFERATITRQKETLESELTAVRQEAAGLRSTVASLSAAQEGIRAELASVKLLLEAAQEAGRTKDGQITELKGVVKAQNETMEEMTVKMREHEASRRKLHNTIQELKGNIRVFCRVRPLLGDELASNEDPTVISHMNFPDDDGKVVELEKLNDANPNESTISGKKGKYDFMFDRVFPPTSSQSIVFEEISQLVQSALDGYNVCIFAYGQTGSGKTFTMEGATDGDNTELMGMIPRAVEQIFRSAADLREKGWQYEVEVSFLEIYNETIRDLLGNGKDNVKHEIRMVAANSNEVAVSGLTHVKVTTERKISDLLRKASENRAVAETKCNKRSSRSHSVFCMKLTGRNIHTEETTLGLLNLIDLAGSERLKDSGSQGARLKETQSINSSLANLGNVIMALANKEPHIPYRNSKLTHLLQNCLGGSSKTLMFVNVSPKEECFSETLNSLRFATKVNNCNIGTAQKQAK